MINNVTKNCLFANISGDKSFSIYKLFSSENGELLLEGKNDVLIKLLFMY